MGKYIIVKDRDVDYWCCDKYCFLDTNQCLLHSTELDLPDCQDNDCHFEINPEWKEDCY